MAGNFYSEYKIPRHILVRLFNFKVTERTLQAFRKKMEITFQKKNIRLVLEIFTATFKKQCHHVTTHSVKIEWQQVDNLEHKTIMETEHL